MTKYYIWLQLCLNFGNSNIADIMDRFSTPENLYNAAKAEIKASGLFTPGEFKRISSTDLSRAEEIIDTCKKSDIEIITYGSQEYPFCLSVIENPPLVLYVKGKLPDFDNIPSVAVVGPRKVSDFGKRAAFSLSYRLAMAGMIVVSGAMGCDTYAHAGALKAQGVTALVMGCGILSKYLPENEAMRKAVCERGCLISEYPPDTEPTRYTFPIRNRIMSAFSNGTVVIEAGEKSGALITARHALEQGRDVFVIPHSPEDKSFLGSNALLRDGAKPLLDASDIFGEYISRFPDKIDIARAYSNKILPDHKTDNIYAEKENEKENIQIKTEIKKQNTRTVKQHKAQNAGSEKQNTEKTPLKEKKEKIFDESLSFEAKMVYNHLDKQKFLPEEIRDTGLSNGQIMSALTELEMEFLIRAVPGGFYEKC